MEVWSMSPQEAFLDRLMRQRVQGMLEKPEHLKCLRHDHSRLQRIQRLFGRHLDEAGTSMYKLVAAAYGESWDFEDDEKNPDRNRTEAEPEPQAGSPAELFPGLQGKGNHDDLVAAREKSTRLWEHELQREPQASERVVEEAEGHGKGTQGEGNQAQGPQEEEGRGRGRGARRGRSCSFYEQAGGS